MPENILGIVAEYNPLHRGHVYHITESKEKTSADMVVCVMSGNFVQRGEPAIFDKWNRARIAIMNDIDAVIEIPTFYCLGSASTYATAAVSMLESLGCVTHLSFGSESGDIDAIKRVAGNIDSQSDDIDRYIKEHLKDGMSYPSAREAAYVELHIDDDTLEQDLAILRNPNDTLGLEYIRALNTIEPVAIPRIGAKHRDAAPDESGYSSATSIRSEINNGRDVTDYIARGYDTELIQNSCKYDDRWFDLIRFKIMTTPVSVIENAPHGGEGLGNRLREAIKYTNNIDELILYTKSKRYTYTHVSRLIIEVLLGIERSMMVSPVPPYCRVLAFSERGRDLLSNIKKNKMNTIPILTNINKECKGMPDEAARLLGLDILATDVYNLMNGRDLITRADRKMKPEMPDVVESE